MTLRGRSGLWRCFLVAIALSFTVRMAGAAESLPVELQGVGVVEHRGDPLPLGLKFKDEAGREVELGQYFGSGKPVLVVLAYYSCPMLCTLVLNGLAAGLKGLAWTPGDTFEIVTVSIDPRDTPDLAAAKKQNYVKAYGRPSASEGWHFLTGTEAESKRLADALGFDYRWDPRQQQYAHAAVLFAVTPEGRISRYLYGIQFPARDLKLALLEASEGKIGGAIEQLLLFCYHYDPVSRKYALYATNLMRAGGALTALVIGVFLAGFWRKEHRASRQSAAPISGDVHGSQ